MRSFGNDLGLDHNCHHVTYTSHSSSLSRDHVWGAKGRGEAGMDCRHTVTQPTVALYPAGVKTAWSGGRGVRQYNQDSLEETHWAVRLLTASTLDLTPLVMLTPNTTDNGHTQEVGLPERHSRQVGKTSSQRGGCVNSFSAPRDRTAGRAMKHTLPLGNIDGTSRGQGYICYLRTSYALFGRQCRTRSAGMPDTWGRIINEYNVISEQNAI
eukprot:3575947-Rhodomonas_salina.2